MALGLATLTAAQMMGGNQGHMMQNTDSTSQSHPMMQRADSLSTQMSNHWNMMSGDYSKLDSQFQNMMKMNDMSQLKAEMQKYHQNMMQMRQEMMQQHNMCQMMSNMMMQSGGMQGMHGSNGMHGMMGMNGTNGMMNDGSNGSNSTETTQGNK